MPIRSHLSAGAGFLQTGMEHMEHLAEMIDISPSAAIVWCWLVRKSDRVNVIRMSPDELIEVTGVSRPTYFRALKLLEYNRWLGRHRHEIHLNAQLVWRGKHEHIGMAKCLEKVGRPTAVPVTLKAARRKTA